MDDDIYKVVLALKRRQGGGPELLAYKDDHRWADVTSPQINDYIKAVTGHDFTAKDFRTWGATVLAAVALAVSGEVSTPTARRRAIARAIAEVAHYLGNTPAVARSSYVDPRVIDRYNSGWIISGALEDLGDVGPGEPAFQDAVELAVLDLIEERTSSEAVERA